MAARADCAKRSKISLDLNSWAHVRQLIAAIYFRLNAISDARGAFLHGGASGPIGPDLAAASIVAMAA
jgi:hypothetical protein